MPARRRLQPAEAAGESETKRRAMAAEPDPKFKALEFDTCNFLVENVSPEFDPNGVLLRRVFFINEYKTRYLSVGFYPSRNYQPLFEFGGPKVKPIILTDQQVATIAECLPRICEAMCGDAQFGWSDGAFRLNTTGSYRVARLYIEKQYITLKFEEFRYLLNMFSVIQNQMNSYITALPDVMTYVIGALSSSTYIEPSLTASKLILYPQFFEELKTIM